mmetsp:Transcript_29488/g.68659  ORF Transcript_29488/g.68659 Transcript_29488/m.68659 type:complete len:113 (-) Transcript_29488:423-761(-)
MEAITVQPDSANSARIWTTFRAAELSRPEVGSSSMRILGLDTNSHAMATRFISPPLMPLIRLPSPTLVSIALFKPNCRIMATARCLFTSRLTFRPSLNRAAISTVSRTLWNG